MSRMIKIHKQQLFWSKQNPFIIFLRLIRSSPYVWAIPSVFPDPANRFILHNKRAGKKMLPTLVINLLKSEEYAKISVTDTAVADSIENFIGFCSSQQISLKKNLIGGFL